MAVLNELRHVAEEQGHYKGVDVRAVDIGIGHDDYLIITQFVVVGCLGVIGVEAETYTQCLDDVVYLLMIKGLVPHYALHVEDLTADRQDSLGVTVTALLGAAACRVTLNDKELAVGGILVGAVGQFAGKSAS